MSERTEVLAPGEPTLAELAATANREHAVAQDAALQAVQHAILAGEALLAARERCKPGDWASWCSANLDIRSTTAAVYTRIARFKELVLEAEVTSVTQAQRLLTGMPDAAPRGTSPVSPELKERIRQLKGDGLSDRAIAELAGVGRSAVRFALNPEHERRLKLARQKRTRERKARAAAEARDLEIRKAVKKVSKPLAAAYAAAERMQDVIGQAHREAPNGSEEREALSRAGEHYRAMRDEIVRALGIS